MTPTFDTPMGSLLRNALTLTWGPSLAGDVGRLLCILVVIVGLVLT